MILFSFFACDLVSSSSTEPAPDPGQLELGKPDAPAAPAPAAPEPEEPAETEGSATVACTEAERTRLHCELANGKHLAVCEADGGLSLRYGHPAVDLQLPASGHGKDFALTREKKAGDREQIVLVGKKDDYGYHVITDRQEGQFDVVFEAYKGEQRLQTQQCKTMKGVDWTELPEL